jgi:hypothetical protein
MRIEPALADVTTASSHDPSVIVALTTPLRRTVALPLRPLLSDAT